MKVALYIRVSKSDGTQDTARQLLQLREFAKSQKWQIVEEIEEYISGRITNRSGTKRLIALAKSNKIQKVLIHEISRLGRNIADIYNTVEELAKNKVSVFDFYQRQETLDENYNKTLYATIILPVLSGIAEQWLQQHKYRIKSGLEQAKLKGKKLGRPEQEKIKKEDEILELRKKGFIEDEFKMRQKATYSRIAKHLKVSIDTVRRVLKKHNL